MRNLTMTCFALGAILYLSGCSDDTTPSNADGKVYRDAAAGDIGQISDKGQVGEGIQTGDKGVIPDKSTIDGVTTTDTATVADGTIAACATNYAECSTFEDLTAGTATINFGGTLGNIFQPKCIKVKVGQEVTFSGDFSTHPLTQSCGPAKVITNGSGGQALFTFSTAGTYGYYCAVHGTAQGTGMAGAIQVVP